MSMKLVIFPLIDDPSIFAFIHNFNHKIYIHTYSTLESRKLTSFKIRFTLILDLQVLISEKNILVSCVLRLYGNFIQNVLHHVYTQWAQRYYDNYYSWIC